MTTEHDKLRELAQHALDIGPQAWFTRTDLRSGAHIRPADATFIAEAGPAVVLALLDELRDAKAQALREAASQAVTGEGRIPWVAVDDRCTVASWLQRRADEVE